MTRWLDWHEHKHLVIIDGGHVPESPNKFIREALDWFDRFLGPRKEASSVQGVFGQTISRISRSADRFGKIKEKEF